MYCTHCGKTIKENMRFCPYCGMDLITSHTSDENLRNTHTYEEKDEHEEHHNETAHVRQYDLEGMRRKGRFTFAHIYSRISIKNEWIEIVTNVDDDLKQYRFRKSDVAQIKFHRRPIKIGHGIADTLRIILSIIMLPFTYGFSVFAILFFVNIMCCRHMGLVLVNGGKINIAIRQDADAIPFLRELGYPEYDIQKLENRRISDSAWNFREWFLTVAFSVLTAFMISIGIEMYQMDEQPISEKNQEVEDIDDLSPSDPDEDTQTDGETVTIEGIQYLKIPVTNILRYPEQYMGQSVCIEGMALVVGDIVSVWNDELSGTIQVECEEMDGPNLLTGDQLIVYGKVVEVVDEWRDDVAIQTDFMTIEEE